MRRLVGKNQTFKTGRKFDLFPFPACPGRNNMIGAISEQPVQIPADNVMLGNLTFLRTRGQQIFAHGSGSSRLSPGTGSWPACSTKPDRQSFFDLPTRAEDASLKTA
jgi:hypothetical protein